MSIAITVEQYFSNFMFSASTGLAGPFYDRRTVERARLALKASLQIAEREGERASLISTSSTQKQSNFSGREYATG